MQEYLRYLYSGRHYKGNYKITYEMLKKIGYRNLVNEYYKYIKERRYSDSGMGSAGNRQKKGTL